MRVPEEGDPLGAIVAVDAIDKLLSPQVEGGRLKVFLRTKATEAQMEGDRVVSITAQNLDNGRAVRIAFQYILDATELGDMLQLTGTDYVVGAESVQETSEPHAQPHDTKPHCVQSYTYTFALERKPEGENHRIAKPTHYEHYRDHQR